MRLWAYPFTFSEYFVEQYTSYFISRNAIKTQITRAVLKYLHSYNNSEDVSNSGRSRIVENVDVLSVWKFDDGKIRRTAAEAGGGGADLRQS